MAGALSPIIRWTILDNGVPVSGAKLYTYLSGTSTASPVYTTSALNVEHTNPVVADAEGNLPAIYLGARAYRFLVTDADDVTLIPAQDNVYDFGQIAEFGNITTGTITADGLIRANAGLAVDTISEDTPGSGVTVDGVSFEDNNALIPGTLGVTGITTFTADARTTAWTDYSSTSTVVGWTSFTTKKIFYKKVGKLVYVAFQIEGTSDATSATFTLPVARPADGFTLTFALSGGIQDNGSAVTTNAYGSVASGGAMVATSPSGAGGNWTGSGTKRIAGEFWYEAAS